MYEIEAPPFRPRPFWQKPIALLYIALIPTVVAVNYASGKVFDLFASTARAEAKVEELEKEVARLVLELDSRPAAMPVQAVFTPPPVAPAVAPVEASSAVQPIPHVLPIPKALPPVPVITPSVKRTAPVAKKVAVVEPVVTVAKADDIPEAGKFTLLSDEQPVLAVKSTVKLIGDR